MFTIELDTTALQERLKGLTQKQLAYAAVNAINKTAKELQADIRREVESDFTLRRPDFVLRQAAIIKPFASARDVRPFAEIAVGERPRFLLARYEEGGERPVTSGAKSAASPAIGGPARPSFAGRVQPQFTYKGLRLRKRKDGQRRGRQKTFVIPEVGVFQRTGKKPKGLEPGGDVRDNLTLVYAFRRDQQLKKRLGFIQIARGKGGPALARNLAREVTEAIEHARRRGR